MATKEQFQFRKELQRLLREAELRGAPSIELNSGTLHRQLGGYPGLNHQMPSCCQAMYDEQVEAENRSLIG
ncbi:MULTISPECIES: hypothetical protein [Bradyrhizobium]|uniref:hypothetical protein n=1 Tax=Bradyrhizobium TaxID=374 RepID=UPI0010A96AB4|nr:MULTISPECIES: hypothetical protein [Bradyrhizobium]